MQAVLALSLVVSSLVSNPDLLLQTGDKAPPYSMRDLDGNVFSLRDLTGPTAATPSKTVLMVFFATWCEPCKAELPDLRQIEKLWKTREVQVVHVGLSQNTETLLPFSLEQRITWPLVPDSFGLLGRRYGVDQLPHLFIINRDGDIAYQKRGLDPSLFETLNAQLALATGYEAPVVTSKRATNATKAAVVDRFDKELKFARAPSSEDSAARWQPLATYMGEHAKARIDMIQESAYTHFERGIKNAKYDLFNAGPMLCSESLKNYEPVALIEREGSRSYTGITFVPRTSSIKSVADLKGKTIGMVSATSTSGGLYPQKLLLDAGLRPGKDVRIKWFGSHAKVANAVKKGWVHAGACFEDCRNLAWKTQQQKTKATRILAYTADIPAEMIMMKRDLPDATKSAIRNALTQTDDRKGILARISQQEPPISAIVAATEKELESVQKVVEQVRKKNKKK